MIVALSLLAITQPNEAVLLVVAPPRAQLPFSSSALLESAARALEQRTDLELRSTEQAGADATSIAECPVAERLSCWVRAVVRGRPPRVLLVIGVHPLGEEEMRMYAMMVDVESADRILREASRAEEGWREVAERRIFAETARTDPEIVRGADELDRYFERLMEERFREMLEARGYWRSKEAPIEEVRVEAPVPEQSRLAYDLTLWGGVALTAAGAAVAIASAIAAKSGPRQACVVRADVDCPRSAFSGTAFGIGLAVTGAGWSGGTLLISEPGDTPWAAWGAGLALGAIAYVASLFGAR